MLGIGRTVVGTFVLATAAAAPRAGVVGALGPAAPLHDAYHLRLVSAWPQLRDGTGCTVGGQETLEGRLVRAAAGTYSGSLTRTTLLLFCGGHGSAERACSVALAGTVAVRVEAVTADGPREGRSQPVELVWTPVARGTRVGITGSCPREFNSALERMYLTASHRLELALPVAGQPGGPTALPEYGWTAEIE